MMKKGEVVYVLGAGASVCGRAEQWQGPDSPDLPTGSELARYLKRQFGLKGARDLAAVSSLVDRAALENYLRPIFSKTYAPTCLHKLIASMPGNQLVITTNYDSMIEAAFDELGKGYTLIAYSGTSRTWERGKSLWVRPPGAAPCRASPDEVVVNLDESSFVFKLHGSAEAGYVISEEDYFELLADMGRGMVFPAGLIRYLHKRHFLFLGYRLEDWSLRILMRVMRPPKRLHGLAQCESWQFAGSLPRWHSKLWERRGVTTYRARLEDFAAKVK